MIAPGKEGMKSHAMIKSNEIKNFEGLIEGENTSQEEEVPNMFDPVEDLNLEEKANKVQEPFDNKIANAILTNNRGLYRLNNFQQSMQTKEEVRRKQITMGMGRRASLNQ